MSASTVNWGGYGGDFTKTDPYTRTFQDWPSFMKEGLLDINFLMNYKREHVQAQASDYRDWSRLVGTSKAGRHGVVGQGAYLNKSKGTIDQMKSDLSDPNIDGTALYCYSDPREGANASNIPDMEFFPLVKKDLFPTPVDPPVADWIENPTTGICAGYVRLGKKKFADHALVTLKPGGEQTYTDGTGFYAFLKAKPGEYEITAKPMSGQSASAKITVSKGTVSMQDIACKD